LEKSKDALRLAEGEVTKAKGELETKEGELAATKKKLEELIASMPKPTEPGGDLKAQVAEMEAKMTDLDTKNKELEIVKAELTTRVETLSDQRKELDQKIVTQSTVIDRYQKNIMAKGTRGRVLAVNSGWGFVVLSIGDRQGAAANKIMVVVRGGQSIGRVRITNVESSQSVADIIPSSFVRGMYVQPGDDVIFTGDDKVREEQVADAAGAAGPGIAPALPKP
jgi:hypothetical protein